jgi:hypothetical protein
MVVVGLAGRGGLMVRASGFCGGEEEEGVCSDPSVGAW